MQNPESQITMEVARFIEQMSFDELPDEVLRLGKRCVLDGLAVILAGSQQQCTQIVRDYSLNNGQIPESTVFGSEPVKLPAMFAALVNGTAGHAMDWDDTQLSTTPDRIFGLLTHPTVPPLVAALAVAETCDAVSGKEFMSAFLTGFEVECKIAEAIFPEHYAKGFHTSATVGTFGAATAASKLLELNTDRLRYMLGVTASMASGIRVNFGTMTKPLHVGRAAQNGVSAAFLAHAGFEADPNALDGPWGFFQVFGRGFDAERITGKLGKPHTIVEPGVSIKPYPCGCLTHPSMDAIRAVVIEKDLKPADIEQVVLYAGNNILNPIRYTTAEDELQAKFCMPFLLAAIVISRKAGFQEFTPQFVCASEVQALMQRIRMEFDPVIEAKGYDKMRSRVEVMLTDGQKLVREADERYRGGPDHPLSDDELIEKFSDCSQSILNETTRKQVIETIFGLEKLTDIRHLIDLLCSTT
ncbi:MAG: MmgE/PrpD family protein [Desulfobacteraceae bacterium]|jgi:2-methylcitrate dehydratase PrpD